jgi:hypothetical protein
MRSSRQCSLAVVLSVAAVVPTRPAHGLDVLPPLASADDPPLVRLSLVDLYGLTGGVTGQAAAESAAVLARLGARTEVRHKAPSDAHDPRDLLVVVMPGDPGPLLERSVLGAVQRDAPTRALWVFPRTIAAALGLASDRAAWTPEERAVFARALGRVVAHEVVHLTCPWRAHDRSGLMAARMSRATLRGAPFEPEASLRRDFVRGAGAQAGRSSLLAQVDGAPSLPPLTRNSGPAQRPPMARGVAGR